ncbi:hypothetical protein [Dyella silvatica]|uniref:hypothetical protein n=1 Tax=Dyella silvatica TaxID=2992128 RepID=UPI002250CD57|nr:hypothetical protein [Dyella silvatica]
MTKFSLFSFGLIAALGVGAVYAQAADATAPGGAATAKSTTNDNRCVRDTGSHIPPKPGQCLPVAGRVYTQDDIQRTGERQLGPALQKLDPSITVRGR